MYGAGKARNDFAAINPGADIVRTQSTGVTSALFTMSLFGAAFLTLFRFG